VSPDRVLNDLSRLWRELSQQRDQTHEGVLRACAMTLIVTIDETADAQSAAALVAQLMHDHPSRAIILKVVDEPDRDLDAYVSAQCWSPFVRGRQICCEQINIAAPEHLLADVPKFLLGLVAPDVPVVLWVRCPGITAHPEFENIFPLAGKVVVDSECFSNPHRGYVFVVDSNRRGLNVIDLAWTRLTPLRQAIAAAFDREKLHRALDRIHEVTVTGAPAGHAAGKYLASWIRNALPRARVMIETGGPPQLAIRGDKLSAEIALMRVAERSEEQLMREELGITGPDPIFRKCLGL
jgi:glucose-6-phosphate dehydrogenase assembly protein OpcA